jgi:polysaccharide biosynthesis transport protein
MIKDSGPMSDPNFPQASFPGGQAREQGPVPAGRFQAPDLLQVLWRWKWMVLLGAIFGAALALLVWVQLPSKYEAIATIQVTSPRDEQIPLFSVDGMSGPQASRQDEIRVILSRSVIERAVERGRITEHPFIRRSAMSKEEVIEWMRHKRRLTVKPGTRDDKTTIVDIAFRCEDPELSADVVQAIVAAYDEFVSESYSATGLQLVNQIQTARRELDGNFSELSKQLEDFRKKAPDDLILTDSGARDPYTEAAMKFNQEISILEVRFAEIASTLRTIKAAIEAGRTPEAILELLPRTTGVLVDPVDSRRFEVIARGVLESAGLAQQLRNTELRQLRAEEETLLQRYGEGHVTVATIQSKIRSLERDITQIEEQERETLVEKQREVAELIGELKTPNDRLKIFVEGLEEEMNRTRDQISILETQKDRATQRAKNQQLWISQDRLYNQRLESTRGIISMLDESVQRLAVPEYGRKTMKPLEISGVGYLAGPWAWQFLLVGGVLGSSLFYGLSYLLELADRSFRSPEDISTELGLPVLGHVPIMPISKRHVKDPKVDLSVVTVHRSKSTQSEAFRGIRTSIFFNNRSGNLKVIQVTSPVPGDGKSTTASNLAVTIAQSGRKVVLVDADFRRPRIAKVFGISEERGITSVIQGECSLEEAIQETSVENLSLLSCGPKPGNPAELLSGQEFAATVQQLRDMYDFVILDTPPLLAVSDPACVAGIADGVVLTLRLRRNLKPLAARAAQMLGSLEANVVGVVVNGVSGGTGYGYGGYRYGAGYTPGYQPQYGPGGYYGGNNYGYGATYGYGGSYGKYYEDDEDRRSRLQTARGNRRGAAPAVAKPGKAPPASQRSPSDS